MLAPIATQIRRTTLVLCIASMALVGIVGVPALAHAELSSGGLAEMATKAEQEEATATATKTTAATAESSSSSSISGTTLILALGAGGLLLGGIAFVIVRDARSVAPVVEGAVAGNSRNPQARMRRRRAQAKAAKRQRKRNRKR
jgi:hypothetical protein